LKFFLSYDLAVVSIEIEVAMLSLNISLSPRFSSALLNASTLLKLRPNLKDPEEYVVLKRNAQ
jgi:hypothetical protein